MFTSVLITIARTVVREVTQEITKLIQDQLIDMVQTPIQQMVDSVGDGSAIWYGPGANAFVNDCTSMYIPETTGIQESCGVVIDRINSAVDIMDAADAQCRSLVDNLSGVFSAIY